MSISQQFLEVEYNNSVSVSEDGYLTTNILDTGKKFYIEKDKVEEFVNYVVENHEGYKIVYINKNGGEITDEKEETEDNVIEDKIIMLENTVEGNTITNFDNVRFFVDILIKI